MVIVTDVKALEVPFTSVAELYREAPRLSVPVEVNTEECPQYLGISTIKEMVKGKEFIRRNGSSVVIGFAEGVTEALELPLEVITVLEQKLESSEEKHFKVFSELNRLKTGLAGLKQLEHDRAWLHYLRTGRYDEII